MALFLSSFVNRIDKKGRVSVPASFRAMMAGDSPSGFAAFPSYRLPVIEACGLERMKQLAQGVDRLEMFSQEQSDFANILFAEAEVLAFDGEGRVVLSESLMAHAELVDQVAFVGCGSTFQLWQPEAFRRHQAEARARLKNQKITLGRLLVEDANKRGE